MSDFQVRVSIGRVGGLIQHISNKRGFRTGTKAAFVHLKSKLARYPQHTSRQQSQYWTPEQRRGFFYHLKKGNIVVPYVRGTSPNSERLAQRWIVEGEGFGLSLHNRASYASRVQGSKQTAYHKRTGWLRTDKVIAQERPVMNAIIFQEVKRDLSR